MRELKTTVPNLSRKMLAVFALALIVVSFPWLATRAQRSSREATVNVTSVSSHPSSNGETVSIKADAPLSRAQTWQDEEGFHVVGYKWVGAFGGVPRGVKVRRVGDSLELVVPARAGASVTVQPSGNTLDVIVSGGLRADAAAEQKPAPSQTQHAGARESQPRANARADVSRRESRVASLIASKEQSAAAVKELLAQTGARRQKIADAQPAQSQSTQQQASKPARQSDAQPARSKSEQQAKSEQQQLKDVRADGQTNATAQGITPSATLSGAQNYSPNSTANSAQNVAPAGATQPAPPVEATGATAPPQDAVQVAATPLLSDAAQSMGGGSWVFSLVVVGAFLCVGLVVFYLIYRKQQRTAQSAVEAAPASESKFEQWEKKVKAKAAASESEQKKEEKTTKPPAKIDAGGALVKQDAKPVAPVSVSVVPPMLFGAFRIDQEVDKLLRGTPHSIDVLASRAGDDRRAVEASLLKALVSPELSESERARARIALEEYGFVARQSAAVLLAPDAYGRSAAARTLGQVKSPASLPFLLEALYDTDTVVRTEVVASLGTLGLPRAIGALLDMARRHPDIPASLITRALNSCSVDAIESDNLGLDGDWFTGEIKSLEPINEVDQLPEWLEDETLADALERLDSTDVEARVAAANQLSQFQVRRAVEALSAMAARDRDASVRAAAITSLGLINHESVFAAILMGMADESREVRAAAARALSRLNFDRADAYVRVLETADEATLRQTAEACVTAGLARQAMDRLASEDRRQAYEAFSLLSLVARGGQTDVIMHVVKGHPDVSVRLAAARLLGLQGDEDVNNRLRQIAMEGNTPEKLREAILEICERRGQGALGGGSQRNGDVSQRNEGDKSVHPIA
jgi:HEAT repeat protein